jgi:hypothetical protein
MLMSAEPIGGVEYRRWLVERDAYVADAEPAQNDDLSIRNATAKPAESGTGYTLTAGEREARRIGMSCRCSKWHQHQGQFETIVGAWIDAWPSQLAVMEDEDNEPLGETEAEERAAIQMEACRAKAIRKIYRLTGEWPDTGGMSNDQVWDLYDELRFQKYVAEQEAAKTRKMLLSQS